jgi:hypothetical protein
VNHGCAVVTVARPINKAKSRVFAEWSNDLSMGIIVKCLEIRFSIQSGMKDGWGKNEDF